MSHKLSAKLVLVTLGSLAALVVAGAATALASHVSASGAPLARPSAAALPAEPQTPLVQGSLHVRAERQAPEVAAASALVQLSEDGDISTIEKREFAAGAPSLPAAQATPMPPAAEAALPAAAAVAASPEPGETPDPTPENEHPAEVEFKGSVESLSPLIIGGQQVDATGATIIGGPLALNMWVEVEGTAQSTGVILAERIEVEHPSGDDDVGEFEFKGPIDLLPGGGYVGEWVIGGQTVVVTDTAVVDDSRVTLPVVVGDIAEVKATQKADGSLLALRIKIEDREEFENEAEFKGTISGLSCTGADCTMSVGDHTVTTDASTQIDGTLADGQFVEVTGSVQPDGSVRADRIHIEDPAAQPDEAEFRAHIVTLPGGFVGIWTFDGGNPDVTVDAGTLIDQSRGPAEVGALVEVKAIRQGGVWLAVRIQVEND